MTKPLVLIVLDGWGEREAPENNPTVTTPTPALHRFKRDYPHTLLEASGLAVGLPPGQMGNSEVGHLHLGAGRRVPQELTRVNEAIEKGDFMGNPVLLEAMDAARTQNARLHLIGLLSPGGVHSHEDHFIAALKLARARGVPHICIHAILDGRDTPPQSALASIEKLQTWIEPYKNIQIVSVIGRYYAMDRDTRWERTLKAYDLMTAGVADFHAPTARVAVEAAYARGETDEFVKPTWIDTDSQKAAAAPCFLQDRDVALFMNFRADRLRQFVQALTAVSLPAMTRRCRPQLHAIVTLTEYGDFPAVRVAFQTLRLKNTMGEYLSHLGLSQLRLAETEKYAHVTYFFNGGVEKPWPFEARHLIPSPKVATYDLQPEMSALELTHVLVEAIRAQQFDVIICNYANPDMVGHTGNLQAASKAVSVIDACLDQVVRALQEVGGEALITADHGNIEQMYDDVHEQAHTAHTTNPVPLLYIGRPARFTKTLGHLYDVAPTFLYLLGLPVPPEMTGVQLLELL